MINDFDTLEDIFKKILIISVRHDMLELEFDLKKSIYIGGICLDGHEESDIFDFNWELNKKFIEQNQETKTTLKIILG